VLLNTSGVSFDEPIDISDCVECRTTYQDWEIAQDILGWGSDVDLDGDGFLNVAEYSFGLDPMDSSNMINQTSADSAATKPIFRYSERVDDSGIVVDVQTSEDLINWEPAVFETNGSTLLDGVKTWSRRSAYDYDTRPKQFFRTSVTY